MDKPYILIHSRDPIHTRNRPPVDVIRFECALDMDEYVRTVGDMEEGCIIFAGKIEKEYKYNFGFFRELVEGGSSSIETASLRDSADKLLKSLDNLKKEYE